jgi:hypothetical protein
MHGDIMEWPDVMVDSDCNGSHHKYSCKETNGSQEQPLAPRFDELVLIDPLQPGTRNDCGETAENRCEHDRQKPKTPVSPEHLFRSWHDGRVRKSGQRI